MIRPLVGAAILLLAAVGFTRRAHLPIEIVGPVQPRDTSDHVDLLVGQTETLTVRSSDTLVVARWSSGNPTVVPIGTNSGVVRGLKRGYGTITASAGGSTTTIRVCVTDVARDSIPARAISVSTGASLPSPSTGQLQMLAHVQMRATPDWGPCVHWSVVDEDTAFARVDRRGVLTTPKTARFIATIGPSVPD